MAGGIDDQLGEIIVEKPSWRRWPIVFLFSLYGCHYSFQVSYIHELRSLMSKMLMLHDLCDIVFVRHNLYDISYVSILN